MKPLAGPPEAFYIIRVIALGRKSLLQKDLRWLRRSRIAAVDVTSVVAALSEERVFVNSTVRLDGLWVGSAQHPRPHFPFTALKSPERHERPPAHPLLPGCHRHRLPLLLRLSRGEGHGA